MRQAWGAVSSAVVLAMAVAAASAAWAQDLGTFRWQFSPFCNVVTLAVVQEGSVFRVTGSDDQCGGATRGIAAGTAVQNADGSATIGLTIVTPGGGLVTSEITVDTMTGAGTWRDGAGRTGTFVFNPLAPVAGSPRPGGVTLASAGAEPVEFRTNGAPALRLESTSSATTGTALNLVAGFGANAVTAGVAGATIAGGGSSSSLCGAGVDPCANRVTDDLGTVGGGAGNQAGDGAGSTVDRLAATVGGGALNRATGLAATVAGGLSNTASGVEATVGGGLGNTASGQQATVPGGNASEAQGAFSLAAGRRAKALHDGAFVWADATDADFGSTAANQLNVRAAGGARIFSDSSATVGVQLPPGAAAWSALSDRAVKANVRPVDGRAVLERLQGVPVTEWNLISQPATIRHMGPMAQDFHAAFALGESDRHIATSDADGVALAAIQALYQMGLALEQQTAALTARTAALAAAAQALERTSRELAAKTDALDDLTRRLQALEAEARPRADLTSPAGFGREGAAPRGAVRPSHHAEAAR
jgi:hypothetical protein